MDLNIMKSTSNKPATLTSSSRISPGEHPLYLSMNSSSEIPTLNLWGYGLSPFALRSLTAFVLRAKYSCCYKKKIIHRINFNDGKSRKVNMNYHIQDAYLVMESNSNFFDL